jgi:hypothetical protein
MPIPILIADYRSSLCFENRAANAAGGDPSLLTASFTASVTWRIAVR